MGYDESFGLLVPHNRFIYIKMIKNNDIASIEKSLQKLPHEKVHKLILLHLSVFSDFFLNIASYGGEVEKTLGSRVAAKTLAPLSFMIINSIVYTHQNKDAPYHQEIMKMNLPIHEFMNHPLFKFEYSSTSKKFSKNTIECIAYNTGYPKETARRQLKPWLNIETKYDKKLGYVFPFKIMFDTDLFKKSHLWIAKKMGQNWSSLLNDLAELKFIKKNYKIDIDHLSNMNQLSYLRTWIMLHWYWSVCFQYIRNSPLNYNELCVLSSCLFFDNDLKKKIIGKNVDFYSEGVIKPVNISSVAESTLIPRETVSRVVNSLIKKNILRQNNNKVYVTELITDPKSLVASNNKTIRCMLHDSLVIIAHMFNPV